MISKYSDEDLLWMLKIRRFELMLLDLFSKGQIYGTAHTCLGQEYIPVALKPFVQNNDFVISNHRGHGHFIAFTEEIEGLLSEMMGKEGAVCNGYGGSQHLFYKNVMTTGIQGEGVSIALGIAWALKRKHTKNVCFAFVGDGTFGRGSIYESLNMACLYKLPYILVVENNNIAMTTKNSENMSGNIENRVKAFGAKYIKIVSDIPTEIRKQIESPIKEVRDTNTPLVIEFITTRVAAHSKGDDTRTNEELESLRKQYWYNVLKQENGEQLQRLEIIANQEIEQILNTVNEKKEIHFVNL